MLTVSTDNTITFKLQFTPPLFLANLAIRIALLYRKLRFGCAYRRILLTKGKYAIVDTEDFPKLSTQKWHSAKSYSTVYARCNRKNKQLCMHRLIIDVPDHLLVDHINHNGLDNRKTNLRPATKAQNVHNRRKIQKENNSSKYKGVSRNKSRKKYIAYINVDGKDIYLGYFDDEINAAKEYDNAARKYHGEFACLNFPPHYKRNILAEYLKKLSKIISAIFASLHCYISCRIRATSNEKQYTKYDTRATPAPRKLSANSRLIGAGNHEQRATIDEIRYTTYDIRSSIYRLREEFLIPFYFP